MEEIEIVENIRNKKNLKTWVKNSFPALTHKNYLIYFIGQGISLIGTWVQSVTQAWLVLKITNSSFLLGLITALQFTPMLLFSLFAGVLVDRLPKKKILLFTQTGLMTLAFLLGFLVITNKVLYWHIATLAFLLGIFNSFDMPARQAIVVELVGREDLPNGIALNSTIFNLARFLGPAFAGIIMATLGMGACFIINGISFAAAIGALLTIKVKKEIMIDETPKKAIKEIKEGLEYILKTPLIFIPLLLLALISTFALNFNVLVPSFAKFVLGLGEGKYSALMSSMGIGALFGSFIMASLSRIGPKTKVLFAGALLLSIVLILLSISKSYFLTMLLLFIAGGFMISYIISSNTIIQVNAEHKFRGRVMSVYTLVFGGVTPFGAMYAGIVANYFGANLAFLISGIIGIISILIATKLFKKQ